MLSLQFSRSLRSLRVDSFRAAKVGLLLAILLMTGLLAWFFLAKVTLYENSTSIELTDDSRILASFSQEGMGRIRKGQAALVRLKSGSDQPDVTLPAFVYDLSPESNQAVLVFDTNQVPVELQTGSLNGRVEVEVEYLTPVELVVRATGKYLNETEIPVSPQNNQSGSNQGSP
jgi:hypothetical protein